MSLSFSHYMSSALLLSFLETPTYICAGIRLFALLIFLALSPYRSFHCSLLWIWYFLIPICFRRTPPLCYTVIFLSYFVESHSGLISLLPLSFSSPHIRDFPLNLILITFRFYFLFLSSLQLFFPVLFYRFIASHLRMLHSPLSFFPLCLLTRFLLYLFNSFNLLNAHCNSRAEMDFHSPCVRPTCDGLWT